MVTVVTVGWLTVVVMVGFVDDFGCVCGCNGVVGVIAVLVVLMSVYIVVVLVRLLDCLCEMKFMQQSSQGTII